MKNKQKKDGLGGKTPGPSFFFTLAILVGMYPAYTFYKNLAYF